jgi:glucose dehydrogenase
LNLLLGRWQSSSDLNASKRRGDNLYKAASAIDPDTGNLKWHFQEVPNDVWDTMAFELYLADLPVRGARAKL